ncbi:MAG: acetyl-CoA C-acyltransferase [Phycisphaera sp.]|nr:acetyl-CoA C-acyltransferase [Phycisphaera sp.]
MVAPKSTRKDIAVVGGVRTPLAKAGTALKSVHVTELARTAMAETLYRTGWPAARLDEVLLGNVVMPADATNPARVAAIEAGVPLSIPAMTVQRNCASGMEAVAIAASRINSGAATAMLAGGAESMSLVPMMFPDDASEPIANIAKARGVMQKLRAVTALRPRHFAPRSGLLMGLTDPTCGMIMGKTAEVLAHEFDIDRDAQDAYAVESHRRACRAIAGDVFADRIVPMYVGKRHEPIVADVGPRDGQSMEALAKLKPIFDRRDGSVTVGNACQVTDGAAMMLVVDGDVARAEGLDVLGFVRSYVTVGLDPARMGLGPVFAIDRMLNETGVDLHNIDLFEINEAFAAQVLACLKALSSDAFCREKLGRAEAIGEIDPERLNVNGGAIALGHPVGATGARIVLDLLLEMQRRDVEFGLATLCVGGGQGAAMLLQRN